jgi:hypothetical protein
MSRIVLAALLLLPVSLGAQWLDWRTPGGCRERPSQSGGGASRDG